MKTWHVWFAVFVIVISDFLNGRVRRLQRLRLKPLLGLLLLLVLLGMSSAPELRVGADEALDLVASRPEARAGSSFFLIPDSSPLESAP